MEGKGGWVGEGNFDALGEVGAPAAEASRSASALASRRANRYRERMLYRVLLLGLLMLWPLRGAEPAAFQRVPLGRATLSLPAHWPMSGPEIPLWLHLHGATEVVEREFASIGAPGVLVTLTLPGLSRAYAEHFAEADVFAALIREVETALRRESAGQAWRIGRVTVSAFSAGFGGVRELLRQPAAEARIGALVMADSIYCGYAGEAKERRVDAGLMSGFLKFARDAAEGRKRMVISHSAQVPVGYASTTETADYLIAALDGTRSESLEEWRGGLRQRSRFARGQFEVLGFDGAEAEDHLRHLRGIGMLLERVAPTVARSATTLAGLQAQLAAHVGQERFSGAVWGMKVLSLTSGRTLFEHEPQRLLSPASNSKLYVGALALDRLGGDYRIVTPIMAAAKPAADGTIAGDVVIGGRGDPSWNSGAARKQFAEIFAPFVDALARAGVKRIAGDLVADATYFRGGPNGAGWTADDLNDYYGAEISAITLEDNYADLRVTPAAQEGERAVITLLQPHTGLELDNRVVTSGRDEARTIEVRRLPGENVVHVFGQVPLGSAGLTTEATVPRPAQWFAAALKTALVQRGIEVAGNARSVRWPEASPVGPNWIQIAEVASPTVRELVAGFMKPSQNLQTDLVFGHLGERARPADAPAWRSSEACALLVLREFLRAHALEPDDVRFDEGSGLSRNNLTTARATVALLQFMARHPEAEAFRASLPVAGVDGTLRRRMKGSAAEGNVRAKTGTLRWANALSGYVTTAAGEPLAFSVMLNRAVLPAGRSAREDVDAIAEMLARFAGRSDAVAGAADGRE